MLKKDLLYTSLWHKGGIAFIRVITGLFLVYHGLEVFDAEKMKVYTTWDSFKGYTSPSFMPYLGKTSEFVAGCLITIGLFTRVAAVITVGTFLYISFFVGNGKIWYEDQHPFLFVLLALVFFFTGPGMFSIDHVLFDRESSR